MQFEFIGFDPGHEFKKFILAVTEKMQFNAPSDSLISMALRKGTNAVKASCRVVSLAGVFVAEAVSDSPADAIRQIESKIKVQLDRWKRLRFLDGE